MTYLNKIIKYYPIIVILQIPLIVGFLLPIILYNNFYYSEIELDDNFVRSAKNYYLTLIFILNLLCFFILFIIPSKKHIGNKNSFHLFTVIIICSFSVVSTLLSKLFVFEIYYFNLLFYIGQQTSLILFLLCSTLNFKKKELVIIFISIILCNILSLYSGDSKLFLITLLIFLIVGYCKFSFKKFFYTIIICILSAILVLGSKKIYRDYVHYGGMDKLNYKYDDENTTYTKNFDYRNTSDFFLKQKLEFLVYNKSYLYSNICGNGYKYKYNTIIEELISGLVFKDGKYKKEGLYIEFLDNFPEIKKFIELKTKTTCYLFFRFVHRIDFFSPFAQVVSEVDSSNYVKGKTYKPILYTFFPRFIFRNKPIDNADEIYMKLMNNLKDSKDKNRTIISVSIITEAWINFLEKGILIIGAIISIIFSLIPLFYFSNNIFLKVLSSSLIIHVLNFNLSLKQIISGSYQLFMVFILFYISSIIFINFHTKKLGKKVK